MVKMIKSFRNSSKEQNSSNAQNAIIGYKGLMGAVQWDADAEMSFATIVEEVIVLMEHAKIKEKKGD